MADQVTSVDRATMLKIFLLALIWLFVSPASSGQGEAPLQLPGSVHSGNWPTPHLQGIAIDDRRQHLYYSFTTMLVKTDMGGKVIGTVTGLKGTHLGDLAFHGGKIYASLEYKAKKAFYIAIFDVAKITKTDMPHDADGVMTSVFVHEASEDFTTRKYGCSGIDGIAVGTTPGSRGDEMKLMVAYGIYSDTKRTDNDHQILLEYDLGTLAEEHAPFDRDSPHTKGVGHAAKYFTYTGNTSYGIQNLEYDIDTRDYWMAVYRGKKRTFPNYALYLVDGSKRPVEKVVRGQEGEEKAPHLSLKEAGVLHESTGVYGFPTVPAKPSTGLISLGNDLFYLAQSGSEKRGTQYGRPTLYTLDRKTWAFTLSAP